MSNASHTIVLGRYGTYRAAWANCSDWGKSDLD
ncbi:hypothetical protein CHELA17_62260 [Chelatococcus asaccharovorans]|nr:hypothetical protein CHELA17_62260 [Chelatococcus asaccharovorans]